MGLPLGLLVLSAIFFIGGNSDRGGGQNNRKVVNDFQTSDGMKRERPKYLSPNQFFSILTAVPFAQARIMF